MAALRNRSPPDVADLIGYLRLRHLPRDLIAAVEDAMALSGTDTDTDGDRLRRHRSSVNRALAKCGPLRTVHWRRLAWLLSLRNGAEDSVERIAQDTGHDARTLRSLIHDLTGFETRPALDTPGWEWKLEAALRRHRYVTWPLASPGQSGMVPRPALTT